MHVTHINEFRVLVSTAKKQGWRVTTTNNGHWKFTPPDKRFSQIIASGTPGNRHRFISSLSADLKRNGLEIG